MVAAYLLFLLKAVFNFSFNKSFVSIEKQSKNCENIRLVRDYRKKLAQDFSLITTELPGAGTRGNSEKTVSEISKRSAKPENQSIFLANLASTISAKNILELGTSFGLTSAIISLYNPNSNIITIEGNQEIFQKSSDFFSSANMHNIHSVNGLFESEINKMDQKIKFDLIFIDGNHTYEASLAYFELLNERLTDSGILVFDDIYWSEGMQKAWKKIKNHSKVKSSLDYFSFGLISLSKEQKPPHQKKISKLVFSS